MNSVIICGNVVAEPTYSHSVNDEAFVRFFVSVKRESGTVDTVPIIVSIRLIDESLCTVGIFAYVVGQYRSHTDLEGHKSVFVLARNVAISDEALYENVVFLKGRICCEPRYKKCDTGKEITSLIVANNQKHNKSYYLPVVVWDRFAKETSAYNVGDVVECKGRIQSRCYPKNGHIYTVYEMSVSTINRINVNN